MSVLIPEGGYNVREVPPAGRGSRFYTARTPMGWDAPADEVLGNIFREAIADRRADVPVLSPARVTFELKIAVKDSDGEWRLLPRGQVTALQTRESARPGRRIGVKPSADVLDTFALGQSPGWSEAPDDLVWASLLEVCRVHDLEGEGWRSLNDSVARLIMLRAGCEVAEDALPHPFRRS